MATSQMDRGATLKIVVALVMIGLITSGHYLTDPHEVAFHNIFRRLYYIPILVLSFSHEVRGGLAAAALCSLAYVPHAFLMTHHHRDPSPTGDKVLEIVLYLVIGTLTGWLVGREKRSRRALEHSLAEKEALESQLVRAGKLTALGQLTSGLAHEIRNPLASILGSAEALSSEFGPEHRKHPMSELLLKEINRLNRVVSEFLRFARPAIPERRRVQLVDVARQVVKLTASQAAEAGVEVSLDGANEDVAVVDGDPDQLSQVMLNIILNAYQAAPNTAGDKRVEVVTMGRSIGDRVMHCIGVRDNGPGIPEEIREDVFNPYFTTRDGGTGLGLSISSRIAVAHDGFIDIDEREGWTTVWLCLPAREGT